MSTSIHWTPLGNGGQICAGCSSIARVLVEVFGDFPITLGESDMPKLLAMAAVYGDEAENPYNRIADLIVEHGPIMLGRDV